MKSIREQAQPYLLCTAKFPLEALTSSWSIGCNRAVDVKHVRDLCRIFEETGLQREHAENHLLVACPPAAVRRMMDHLRAPAAVEESGLEGGAESRSHARPGDRLEEKWPSFEQWMLVNGSPAEIMAGQHRVEALQMLLKQKAYKAFKKSQSWWICDVYNSGRASAFALFLRE